MISTTGGAFPPLNSTHCREGGSVSASFTCGRSTKKLAPNDSSFQFYEHIRLGPQCRRINYLSCIGPRLFNIIPKYIKQSANLNICKGRLDKLLLTLTDEPPTPGYRSSHSNSLLEMVRHITQSFERIYSSAPGGDDGTAAGSRS